MENAPDYAVPQLGDTLPNILDGQAERQKAGIPDLDPVIKQGNSDGRSVLGVVRVDDCIHERLPDCNQRNRPTILPSDSLDD